jgi:hypothetical protein
MAARKAKCGSDEWWRLSDEREYCKAEERENKFWSGEKTGEGCEAYVHSLYESRGFERNTQGPCTCLREDRIVIDREYVIGLEADISLGTLHFRNLEAHDACTLLCSSV